MITHCYWACKDIGNFGDELTPYLFEKITGKKPNFVEDFSKPHNFLVGSILQEAKPSTIVLGVGFGARNQTLRKARKIAIVRGHLTGKMLEEQGFKKDWEFGDPSLVLPLIFSPKKSVIHKSYFLVLPHYIEKDLEIFSQVRKPFLLGDITRPVEEVIELIVNSKGVVTSSLHGLVVAQTYGVPVRLVSFSNRIAGDGMKYLDYASTVGLQLPPIKKISDWNQINDLEIFDQKINFNRKFLLNKLKRELV